MKLHLHAGAAGWGQRPSNLRDRLDVQADLRTRASLEVRPDPDEIARNVVESQRLSTLIDYATAAPFAIGFLETALAIEDSSNGI